MRRDTITQAVVDLLNANDVLTGRGVKPAGSGWQGPPGQSPFVPYAIVWRIGSKDLRRGSLDGAWDESRPLFHVRAVGGTPAEADGHLDDADEVLRTQPLVVAGLSVVHLVFDVSITTTKDSDVEPPVFYTGSYWRWWLQETT